MILRPHERLIIKRYVIPRGGERVIVLVASISLLAVTLGVAALVIVESVMNGYQSFFLQKVVETTGHAIVRGERGVLAQWQTIASEARRTPGVTAATPLIERTLMLSSRGRVAPASLRGMPGNEIKALEDSLVAGRLDVRPGGGVVLGSRLAELATVGPGGSVELVVVEESGGELDVRPVAFQVTGIVETGAGEFDQRAVLMPLEDAQALLGLGDAATSRAIGREEAAIRANAAATGDPLLIGTFGVLGG